MPRALIIDDDVFLPVLFSLYLRDRFDCDAAHHGTQAVNLFGAALDRGSPYAVVLTDLYMPGMNGLSAIREMRRLEESHGVRGCRMVLVSSDHEALRTLARLDEAHIQAFLPKPCLRQDVEAAVGLARGDGPQPGGLLGRGGPPCRAFARDPAFPPVF